MKALAAGHELAKALHKLQSIFFTCLPPCRMWALCHRDVTSLHEVTGPVAIYFVSLELLSFRNTRWPGSLSLGHGEADLVSEEEARDSMGTCGEAVTGCTALAVCAGHDKARQGRAGRGRGGLPSPAAGYARLPNWLSLRLLFIQIRRSGGYADHLMAQTSEPCPLAGRLAG